MGVASELQQIGVIGDEVTLAGMQQLATFQLSEKEIATLAGGMTDLLAQQTDRACAPLVTTLTTGVATIFPTALT